MFYRSTMLIVTHVYFFPRRIVCGTNVYERKSMYSVCCTHTEMCSFSFFSSIACIFHIRLILFFSCLNLPLALLACLSLSLSLSVIVVASWNSDTCSTVMREAFPVIHIFIHNKSMQIALIRARARIGCVVFLELNVLCTVCMFACHMRNGNPHIFYQRNIDNTGSFS